MADHLAPQLGDDVYNNLDQVAQRPTPVDRTECNNIVASILGYAELSEKEAAAIILVLAASPSPAEVNGEINRHHFCPFKSSQYRRDNGVDGCPTVTSSNGELLQISQIE